MSATITAQMVRDLRDATGAGMMECKKALVECDGDFNQALDFLRIKGSAKAERVSGRAAAEGRLACYINNNIGVLAEVNCETDFVARGDTFGAFCQTLAAAMATTQNTAADSVTLADNRHGEQARQELIMQVGENVSFGRAIMLQAQNNIAFYTHTGDKIAAMIDYSGGDETMARDICMHIAAMRPEYITHDKVPADELHKQRELLTAQAAESGKPAAVIEKMIDGRLKKHFAERVLCSQPFVKDGDKTIGDILTAANMHIGAFHWLAVGGGKV